MIRKLLFLLFFAHNTAIADIVISADSLNESYSENVEVAGEYLVGIQLITADKEKLLHVMLPDDSKGNLCIDVSSIDGKYKAKIKHKITSQVSGLTMVSFKSDYQKIMKDYTQQEMSVSASLRDSCDNNDASRRLVSSWGSNVTNELVLLIRSSARKDVAYIPNKDKYVKKAKCKKFRKSNNVRYDKYCVFKGIDLNQVNEIEIVRKNLQPIESEKIKLN